MAKKKKRDDGDKDAPASAAAPASSGEPTPAIDAAYARGNYALVRKLAAADASEHAQKLKSLVQIDPVQLLVGAGAILVVALAAFLTLKP